MGTRRAATRRQVTRLAPAPTPRARRQVRCRARESAAGSMSMSPKAEPRRRVEHQRDQHDSTESRAASSCTRTGRRRSRRRCSTPNARSGSATRRNDTAKTTPAKKIGVNASRHDAGDLRGRAQPEESVHRHERRSRRATGRARRSRRSATRGRTASTKRFAPRIISQHRAEDDRVHDPGAAEEQRHLHDGLGLDQHEAGAEEEHLRRTRRRGSSRRRPRRAAEQERQEHDQHRGRP